MISDTNGYAGTKNCLRCGASFRQDAIACAYCGRPFTPDDRRSGKSYIRTAVLWVGLILALIAGAGIITTHLMEPDNSADSAILKTAPVESSASTTSAAEKTADPNPPKIVEVEPPDSGDVFTPWQLLKNPFRDQNKLVRLDVQSIPVIYGSVPGQYVHQGTRSNLSLNRMMAPNEALYDVMGIDAQGSMDLTKYGEILVMFDHAGDTAPINRNWVVIPISPTDGTNAFGASIKVATVRFHGIDSRSERIVDMGQQQIPESRAPKPQSPADSQATEP